MQSDHTGFSPSGTTDATPGFGSSGGAPPPGRHTRYNTLTMQPAKLGAVRSCLLRRVGRNGITNKNEVIAAIRSVDRGEYADSAGQELFRFLEAYGALYQRSGRWWVESLRFQELIIACDNKKPLPYDFVVTTVPGAACGCPQGSAPPVNGGDAGKPAAKGSAPPVNGGDAGKPAPAKPVVIRRVAYMTYLERHALEVIDVSSIGTVVGEFRSPTHLDDDAFAVSDFGKLFGCPRAVFVAMLERLVAGKIVEVRKGTGPAEAFDALVVAIPLAELQIVDIPDRRPQAIPAVVMDLIVRTLDLEGFTSFKDGLMTTVKKAMVARLGRRGIGNGDKVVSVFANRLFHYNETTPENGWGLVLPGGCGVDAVICLPGFAPVQFVEDSTIMRELPRGVTIPVPAPEAPPAPSAPTPQRITAADVPGMDDATLATAIAETEALLEALKAEAPRREEARRKAVRRAELEAQRVEAMAAEAREAEEKAQADAAAAAAQAAAQQKAEAVEAARRAREALEAEIAGL